MSQHTPDSHLVNDLEQRIETLQQMDDAEFGQFTSLDWLILILSAVVLPIIALIVGR